jgi:hypothetical protein
MNISFVLLVFLANFKLSGSVFRIWIKTYHSTLDPDQNSRNKMNPDPKSDQQDVARHNSRQTSVGIVHPIRKDLRF